MNQNSHVFATNEAVKATYVSILTNFCLALIKGFAGVFGSSYALVADAIESLTDIFSSFAVLFGLKYANRPADENHPYGHGKIEPLVTFIVVCLLVVSAVLIAFKSIDNIRTPHESPKAWTIGVLVCIIVWKEMSYQYVKRKGLKLNSTSLLADAWHHRSDAITSVIALLGILISIVLGPGYEMADDYAALFASFFILYNSYLIFRPALGEVMDEHLYDDLIEKIRIIAVEVEGIRDTEKCFIRKSGMTHFVDLHAVVDGDISVKEGHDLSHKLKAHLINEMPSIGNVLIHIEPDE